MEDNENVVTEVTENVDELTTEQLVDGSVNTIESEENQEQVSDGDNSHEEKIYTQADIDRMVNEKVNEILPRKIERAKSKIERQYQEKYGRAEVVLNAGMQTNSLEEATRKIEQYYEERGLQVPNSQNSYTEHDLDLLAKAEAQEIINYGFDEIVEETDRLAQKGANNMTSRERKVFQMLAEERLKQENLQELAKIGVSSDVLENKEFQNFQAKLNPNLSLKEKYEMYTKFNPKPKVEPIGSMKSVTTKEDHFKEFYTPEEARKLTSKDLDDPRIMQAVEKSMQMWES